jgi:hypothetical protein
MAERRVQTRVEQRHRPCAAPFVVDGIRALEVREDRSHVCRRLFDRDAGLQSAEGEEKQPASRLVPVEAGLHDVVHGHRDPHRRVAAEHRAGKTLGGDANDREGHAVQRERLADDIGIAAEAALPEAVADDRDRRGLEIFVGMERAPAREVGAEKREVIAGDDLKNDLLRRGPAAPIDLRKGHRRHLGEDVILIAQILEVEMRDRQVAGIPLVGRENRREPIGFPDRDRLQHRDVHEAENRGVRADAESEREYGDCGECRALHQHPQAVAEVLNHGVQKAEG